MRSIALSDIVQTHRRIFMMKPFARWARKVGLAEQAICNAVVEMASGLIDADLGAHVFKKRVALAGRGKSGGARVLVGTNLWDRWFFLFGFEKNQRSDVNARELKALQVYAAVLLKFDRNALAIAADRGELMEICREEAKPNPE